MKHRNLTETILKGAKKNKSHDTSWEILVGGPQRCLNDAQGGARPRQKWEFGRELVERSSISIDATSSQSFGKPQKFNPKPSKV